VLTTANRPTISCTPTTRSDPPVPDGAVATPRADPGGRGQFGPAAAALLDHLVVTARPGRHGPTWPGRALGADGDGRAVAGGALGDDLFAGRAGIAWVVARTPAGHDLARAVLHGAVDHALSGARLTPDPGLFNGATGIALVAADVGRRLDDLALVERAQALGGAVARSVIERATELRSGLLSGRAGVVLGLLALLGQAHPDAAAAVTALGDVLVGDVDRLGQCGLAQGASGVALALDRLAAATGDDRYGTAAAAAIRFERACFSPTHGWPDRRPTRTDRRSVPSGAAVASPTYSASWCHGAAGIGLARWATFAWRGDPAARAEAGAAVGFARSAAMAALSSPEPLVDSSLCHGLAGAVELFLAAWEATGAPEHLAAARRTGGLLVARAEAAGGRYGSGRSDREPTPGLFLGTAGVAATLLRLQDPAAWPSAATFPWWSPSASGG
jgi:lantibiotic modifying enzyme